jgi:hypothetical protein
LLNKLLNKSHGVSETCGDRGRCGGCSQSRGRRKTKLLVIAEVL